MTRAATRSSARHRFGRTRIAFVVATSLIAIAACGDDDDSSTATDPPPVQSTSSSTSSPSPSTSPPSTAGSTPASVDTSTTPPDPGEGSSADPFSVTAANGDVSLDAKPVKIVSLSATATEMLFAIGAGDQVVAVDDQSNFPAEAAAVASDLSGLTPNVEAIAGYQPDLVVIGDDFNSLGVQLAAVDIPVWSGPAATTLDDVYAQIEQLGVLTDHVADAAGVVADIQSGIDEVLADVPETEVPLTYYHELDPTYFSVTSATFIGQLYSLAGLQNIADEAEATSDYPQLSSELIVTSNPDLIFLADTKCCGESAATVAARDGWAGIAAVVNGQVIEMDDDLASRWGPRVVDYLRAIVDAVVAASAVSAG